ncbi:MAG: ybaK/ebsC protein [Clostridiales bacterium]|jgi:Cys-tRNA(Pro)/Cys-tRNA(Cys) deacylase|nr:ybaK/ebsC protein [Clostridiales bacterium]
MEKEIKTNAMRLLEKSKITFQTHTYESDEFLDGVSVARKIGQPVEKTFKTLVTQGKSKNYFVFLVPVAEELDLKKAAKAVAEKSIEMIQVKDINQITGYIRGGCSPIGMKKQFKTVIHNTAVDFETILFSGGRLGTQIEMSPQDLLKVIKGNIEDIIIN